MQATLGTVTEGTLREDDLIEAFLGELSLLNPAAAKRILSEYPRYEEEDENFWTDEAQYMIEDLQEALNLCAPSFSYFGAHYGDGACFGFWADIDSLEEAAHFGHEVLKVNDLSEVESKLNDHDYVMLVNDHGNVTLYRVSPFLDGEPTQFMFEEVWSIV